MRPGAEFLAVSRLAGAPTATAPPHSAWQSPVPYLFGGLAAMLGLIAFALLILACSYWKLSGFLDGASDGQAAGDADGEKASASGASKPAPDFQEHVVVIMAGDERPTFLAKPVTSRAAEAELAAAAAPDASARDGEGQEETADEQGGEASSHPGADAASRSRDHHEDAAGQSGDHDHDAASHHHHDQDLESSGTTALQESRQ
ncbi:protein GLUTAMINE DUMPER 1-like [Triticum dicoccoides]|uniref:protein GLUTAMINE DUMPER 1-like n=1 Tax=Triticum dicoccoides TaxID=85692 RepID=UPI0008433D00|nr:protein GLUTAMINE DUMPER 1-like [Triticum dicoccoides]XP_044429397.1 protein GLUTAMINE DUMPER 1-like [Triticum aestivum]